ncbi:N-acetylmuramoyl-L-alanine amidase [Pseudomonas sp. NPDC098747]|uniref:N-acetylmuramoyl-L-alanine amidase n=1 Tax=Pseudomonas sp. NPDC098747 TaxID=3364487 RepID=UPI00383A9E27
MNFHFPIRKTDGTPFTDANELFQTLENETSGHYLMGAYKFWHGGIHISDQSAPQCVANDTLRCMADGEVVAYRLNNDYRHTSFGEGGQKLKYSNSFCLVRHEYASEPNSEEGANYGKRNPLTFYSLYMHLLPYSGYQLPERVRPDYWQGKVKATAIKRLPLYGAPVNPIDGQSTGVRKGNAELCISSVIEFDSRKVLTLMIDNQRRRMAECTLVSGGCWGQEPVPATFWTIVENETPNKLVAWGPVTPSAFDEVISTSVPIKAGDPIGYLGNVENLTNEEGGTESAHQVHLELFATDADVKDFLQNAAGLKTGKQFLHLPSATVLKKKAPAMGSVKLRQKHVIDLSAVPVVQDGGEECYDVSVVEREKPVSGLLKKTDADIISQHDREKLGFQIVAESNAMADGFVDPDDMPQFFRDLFASIDTNGNRTLEPDELKSALMNPATRDQWTRLVAHHPTEWKEKAGSPKWSRLDQLFPTIPKTVKHEKQRIDNFVFWDELSGSAQMASGLIYHFHPIAFVESMMGPDRAAAREAIIQKVQSLGHTFTERSGWGAVQGKPNMVEDWDYSMIALHHAGRSSVCTPRGDKQMLDVQAYHMAKGFDDIGYHYGIACDGTVLEGRDIRLRASSVRGFNTGVIGIVLLENLTTAEEGGDVVAKWRETLELYGSNTTNVIPAIQIDALLHLVEALKSVFVIERFGGHREFPGQDKDGKICPGNIGMELVRNIRTQTQLLPPPGTIAE